MKLANMHVDIGCGYAGVSSRQDPTPVVKTAVVCTAPRTRSN